MKEIQLTQGKVALIDDEDYEYLNQWKWTYSAKGYAYRMHYENRKQTAIYMHRLVAKAKKGEFVDHANGCKLDNRKSNLRICNQSQNNRNVGMKGNKNGFKGVVFHKLSGLYRAEITVNYKLISLGYYKTALEAALAYNEAAIKYHGQFAKLNVIAPGA